VGEMGSGTLGKGNVEKKLRHDGRMKGVRIYRYMKNSEEGTMGGEKKDARRNNWLDGGTRKKKNSGDSAREDITR